MSIDRAILAMAGFFVLLSVALGSPDSPIFHSTYWLWFTAFVGANVLQSAFSGWCPAVWMLKKMGVKSGSAF